MTNYSIFTMGKSLILGGALLAAAVCAPVSSRAAETASSFILAQGVDIELGPGGVRVAPDRERRRFEERRRFDERDRFEERRRPRERFGEGGRGCRTIIVRRETEYGVRTSRVRRCD